MHRCGFEYTKMYNFRPFSDCEIQQFFEKRNLKKTDILAEAKKIGLLMPRMILQCSTSSEVRRWVDNAILHVMLTVQHRLTMLCKDDPLRNILMKAAMDEELNESESVFAQLSGLFYMDSSDELHMLFPAKLLLPHLRIEIISCYTLLTTYDTGVAFEFLTCAQLKSVSNRIFCTGSSPTPVCSSLSVTRPSNGKEAFIIPTPNQYMLQSEVNDELKGDQCCLVKLHKQHFGVDFLVVYNPAGSDSKRLFLIQASVSTYQRRNGPKLKEVYENRSEFGKKSLVEFYCAKLSIRNTHCFFVYATSEVPSNESFTRDTNVPNKVYFLEIKCRM